MYTSQISNDSLEPFILTICPTLTRHLKSHEGSLGMPKKQENPAGWDDDEEEEEASECVRATHYFTHTQTQTHTQRILVSPSPPPPPPNDPSDGWRWEPVGPLHQPHRAVNHNVNNTPICKSIDQYTHRHTHNTKKQMEQTGFSTQLLL